MKRSILALSIILLFSLAFKTRAQTTSQTVTNGSITTAVNFSGTGCTYNWVNNTPSIGLPASGTGDIGAFTAVNTGNTPITATITATPAPTGFAYVAGYTSGTVSVVDVSINAIVKTIPVGLLPSRVSVSPDGSKVYVGDFGSKDMTVINTANNTVAATINIGAMPGGIAVSPDNSKVYVTASDVSRVLVISAATNTVITSIPVGSNPQGILITPDGSRAYVVNNSSNTVSVINTLANTVINTIAVGPFPVGIACSPNGSLVYVANSNQGGVGTVSVINTITNTVTATITVGSNAFGIAVSPDGNTAYVTNNGWNTVSVINTASNTVIATITTPVAGSPTGVSVSSDGKWVYVENYVTGTISIINTTTNSIAGDIPLNTQPVSLGNFLLNGTSCTGSPITFTITVKPLSVIPTFIGTAATGTISACQGSPSASPNLQQFTISGTSLTNNITATAPPGFEVSLTSGGSYGNAVTIPQSGGTVNNATVYVRSAASATGDIGGNVVLSSSGAPPQNVAVLGKVNTLPTVNSVGNNIFINGNNTTAINFTGTAKAYTWVNNLPGIGLSAGGTGNIPAFTAVNNSNTPVTATVTVTPTNKEVYAYIPNSSTSDVSVVDLVSNKIVATIPVGRSPIGVSVSSDGTKAYVTNQKSPSVSVINTVNNTLQTTIPFTLGSDPTGIIVSPDGSKIYVANYGNSTVSVINTANNSLISTVAVGGYPFGIGISPDGSKVYTANVFDNTVSVINTATNTVIATIPTGMGPNALCISPDGSRLYVANYNSNDVSVIDAINNTLITSVSTGAGASVAALSQDGKMLYVSNINGNTVSVINTANNSVIATIPVNRAPFGLSVSRDGSKLYVAQLNSKTITIVNTLTNTVVNTIDVGLSPYAVGNFISETPGCDGPSKTFTITVNPSSHPIIYVSGTLSPLLTTYGTSSASTSFTVSGANMTSGILVAPPPGFEVSTDNANFSTTLTVGAAGAITATTVYIRLSAKTPVGNYPGSIILSSPAATNVNAPMPISIVNPAPLNVTANTIQKTYGSALNNGPVSIGYIIAGLQNNETAGNISMTYNAGAVATANVGTYTGSVVPSNATGGTFNPANYTITYIPGDIIVNPALLVITADNVQKEHGKTIIGGQFSTGYSANGLKNNETIGSVHLSYNSGADASADAGTYTDAIVPSNANGGTFSPSNYAINYVPGTLTVIQDNPPITIPNAFSPNGDGINDLWNVASLINYPSCLVSIFTRYGSLIYQSKGYARPWDGNYNGSPLPMGTYYYIINLQNGHAPISGYVALIR